MLRVVMGVVAATALAACGGSTATGGTGGAAGSAGTGGAAGSAGTGGAAGNGGAAGSAGSGGAATCPSGGGGTPAEVTITFPAQPCTYSVAQAKAGVTFLYTVNVAQAVSGVVPAPGDSGGCAQPGPSGLITAESISGNGQSYCLCDTGLCAPPSTQPVTLQPGHYDGNFAWDGTNWSGPSDTGNPHGPVFPPGTYTFGVSAKGTVGGNPFQVNGSMTFTLTP